MPKVEFIMSHIHLWRIKSQNLAQVVTFEIFNMLLEYVIDICRASPGPLDILEIVWFCD